MAQLPAQGAFPTGPGEESMGSGSGGGLFGSEGRVASRPVNPVNLKEAENQGEQLAATVQAVNAKHGMLYRKQTHPGLEK